MLEKINIVMPVYNEEKSISNTIIRFNEVFKYNNYDVQLIISEDGSTDDSVEIIKKLKKNYEILLLSSKLKGNYNSAVLKGLSAGNQKIVAFVDSDGQYDPEDLLIMIRKLKDNSFVAGYRNPRVDSPFRKLISNSFKLIYYLLFRIKLKDPSCSYFVGNREDIEKILKKYKFGHLPEGFWWEFYACSNNMNINIIEVPVNHFKRNYGNTVVFKLSKLPKIGYYNLLGLFKLKKYLTT